jgi:hypothetical protein
MSELTLLLLRFGFLILLWFFVFAVVYALRTDLFGQRVKRLPAEQPVAASPFPSSPFPPAPAAASAAAASAATERISVGASSAGASTAGSNSTGATRLVITSGPKQGLEMVLPNEPLTIGRSSESGLVIRDDYTSTHHARLMKWTDDWVIQDLDSTNGTFLGGTRVTLPTPVPLNTPIKIGTTSFELRR